jgi:hypothetical protein
MGRIALGLLIALAGNALAGYLNAMDEWPRVLFFALVLPFWIPAGMLIVPEVERFVDRRRRARRAAH